MTQVCAWYFLPWLMWQSYFFIFRRLKNNVTYFKQHFYKQHQAEIWSEIVKISSIKRSKTHSKWKTELRVLLLQSPSIKIYSPPMVFQKAHPPMNKGVHTRQCISPVYVIFTTKLCVICIWNMCVNFTTKSCGYV